LSILVRFPSSKDSHCCKELPQASAAMVKLVAV
jgi:hypothetical protein